MCSSDLSVIMRMSKRVGKVLGGIVGCAGIALLVFWVMLNKAVWSTFPSATSLAGLPLIFVEEGKRAWDDNLGNLANGTLGCDPDLFEATKGATHASCGAPRNKIATSNSSLQPSAHIRSRQFARSVRRRLPHLLVRDVRPSTLVRVHRMHVRRLRGRSRFERVSMTMSAKLGLTTWRE